MSYKKWGVKGTQLENTFYVSFGLGSAHLSRGLLLFWKNLLICDVGSIISGHPVPMCINLKKTFSSKV